MIFSMTLGTVTSYADSEDAAVSETPCFDAGDALAECTYPVGGRIMPEAIILDEAETEALDAALAQRVETFEETNYKSASYTFSSTYYFNTFNAAERSFYNKLDASCKAALSSTTNYSESINSSDGPLGVLDKIKYPGLTYDRAIEVFWAFLNENPQYYFLDSAWGKTSNEEFLVLLGNHKGHNFSLYSERKTAQTLLDNLVNSWMPEIEALSSPYDREMLICEKICKYLTYDDPALSDDDLLSFDQSIISGVMRQTTVCKGYAMLTAFFMNAAGIDCIGVDSAAHAWNAVKLYNKWYQLDLTWGDDGSTVDMNWVNKSYNTFQAQDTNGDHKYDTMWDNVTMPPCTSDTIDFPDDPNTAKINSATFPDTAFRNYISSKFDTNSDNTLSAEEIAAATDMVIAGMGIAKLNGIEKFTALKTLDCSDNSLTAISLVKNKELVSLDCSGNKLKALDVSDNTKLQKLVCSDNQITSLDLGSNTQLTELAVRTNLLSSLDVSKNTLLTKLDCADNKLTELNVTKLSALKQLLFDVNQVQEIDLTKNTLLETLDCSHNQLVCLNLGSNPSITNFACENNERNIGGVTGSFALSSLSGFDPSKASDWNGATYDSATKSIKDISYEGVTYKYDCGNSHSALFTLIAGKVKSIAVKTAPTKTAYYTGDAFDVTGGTITVTFEDGRTKVIDMTLGMISGYDPNKTGKQTITVTYGEKTATFNISVTALTATKLEIAVSPKTSYFLGDDIDLSAGKFNVTYNSGKSETVPMTDSRVKVTGFDSSKTGTKRVTLSLLGKSVVINMEVAVDPANAPVVINGAGYETIAAGLKAKNTGDLDILINVNITEKNLNIPKTVTSAKLTTAAGKTLTLTTPNISANCDMTFDAAIAAEKANAKTLTIKAAADKKVTIKRLDSALPLTLSGTKTSSFVLDTGSTLKLLSGASANFEIAAGTTAKLDGGKFTPASLSGAGKLDVYNAAVLNIANSISADVTLNKYVRVVGKNNTVNLQKFTLGTVTKLNLTVKEADGTLSNITGQTVITLAKQDVIPDLETKITITNTANGKPLSAVQYKKDVRAEYLDALTLVGVKNFSSFDKAFEAMTDPAGSYTLRLNEDIALSKVTFPKAVDSLTIDGNGKTLTLNGVTTLSPKFGFSLKNINIKSFTRTGAAGALTLNLSSGASAIDGLAFTGTALNIKGGKDSTLTLGVCSQIASLGGFADTALTGVTTIEKVLTANNITLGSAADLRLLSGAQFTVNRGMVLSATTGAKITLTKGFKPIMLNGSVSGAKIKLVSAVTLEDQPIFKTKSDLTGLFDISGISPSNGLSYDLLTSNGTVYLKAFTIELNGVKYAFWDDVIKAMNSKTTDYTISLLADITIDGALKLPTAAKCGSLTINGNGHKLVFTGNSVSLTVPTTLKNITISAYNKRTGAGAVWKLVTNKKLTKSGTVNLVNCTEK
ncbi:MAG: bacterial Ig-like domain-containing protein [Ruminiclostridium sp.]|nr:bacterial Ig-like domain-containing protein [Ruminiclostridium sp.]